ncbi:hypothetical protein X291_04305 [Oenococcus oeni IOEB_C23]|uniref:glycosyltransferase n=1 Tax=Oenococcus oeni TaxID=1247 RepID=UPI00050F555D|nr:glycosyltransferase [Oenococcus oeni]KGH65877.1 hypothetical protein X291_04305 [Oenococcus oeni IOEB_C23]OIM54909.1 hypothetical protein ATX80_07155 [Oenococcus oeni]
MTKKIAVLMSTYNGAKYVEEQIASIFESFEVAGMSGHLFIRDDFSKDNTLSLVTNLKKKYNEITVLQSYSNLGFKLSFWELLKHTEGYDYYFFSDQDDIWDPDKVKIFVNNFDGLNNTYSDTVPLCVYSDLLMFGSVLSKQIKVSDYFRWNHSLDGVPNWFFANTITGASMAINDSLRKFLVSLPISFIEEEFYHDSFIAKIVGSIGKFKYIPLPLTKYRQHTENQSKKWGQKHTLKQSIEARKNDFIIQIIIAEKLLTYFKMHGLAYNDNGILHVLRSFLNNNHYSRIANSIKISRYLIPVIKPVLYRKVIFIFITSFYSNKFINSCKNKKIVNYRFVG